MSNEKFTPISDPVKTHDGREVSIKGFQESLINFPMSYHAAMDDYGKPYLTGSCVYKTEKCGCEIHGNGTLQFPIKIKYCNQHNAAPDMYEALKAVQDCLPFQPTEDTYKLVESALSKANP